jgi:hypothetical protein
MNRTSVLSVMVLAASLVSAQAVYAAPFGGGGATTVNAAAKSGKTVKFSLHNDSENSMKLKVGEQEVTLAAHATINVKATVGQTVMTQEASATSPAGTVLATVIDSISGATVVVR